MNLNIQINVVINKFNNLKQPQAVKVAQQVDSDKKWIVSGISASIPFVIVKIIIELFDKFS